MNNFNLNKKISEMFLTDARDYLKRYEILKEKSTHIGLRGKILIELLFAVECALKSLIFIESEFDEKTTYHKIHTHKLHTLINMLSAQSKNEYDKIVTTKINHFIVGIRYQLESVIDFTNEHGVLDKKYYNTIANFEWLDNLSFQISNFIDYIEVTNPFEIEIISFSEINIEEEIEKHTRLVKLRN